MKYKGWEIQLTPFNSNAEFTWWGWEIWGPDGEWVGSARLRATKDSAIKRAKNAIEVKLEEVESGD